MEVSLTRVPVTALHLCCVGTHDFLLSGEGSSLHAYSCLDSQERLRQRVFIWQVIHGITSQDAPSFNGTEAGAWVLLWAGNAVSFLQIRSEQQQSDSSTFLEVLQTFTIDLTGWALYGNFFKNSDHGLVRAYLVTAHNEVHELLLHHLPPNFGIGVTCGRLVAGPASVLYSAHAHCTPRGLLVAAGTVFGEIVVWSAIEDERSGMWTSRICNVARGHSGSVFGVCLSEAYVLDGRTRRLLATCSDDRTIKLWTVSEETESSQYADGDKLDPPQLSDVTGFGDLDDRPYALVASAWGHLSRIWSVKFLPAGTLFDGDNIHLISTGEDATVQLWEAALTGPSGENSQASAQLRKLSSYANHLGKNVWSSAFGIVKRQYTHYTGGADSMIVATRLKTKTGADHTSVSILFSEILSQTQNNDQNEVMKSQGKGLSLKQYAITNKRSVFATTDKGIPLCGKLNQYCTGIQWHSLHSAESKTMSLLCSDKNTGSAFFASVDGNLHRLAEDSGRIIPLLIAVGSQAGFMCIAPREDTDTIGGTQASILITFPHNRSATLLCVSTLDSTHLEGSAQLTLPPNFVPTSACHHVKRDLLLLGSRSGSIAIYVGLADCKSPTAVFPNVHGADTVTSLIFLREGKASSDLGTKQGMVFLSTGRDGTYAAHRVAASLTIDETPTLRTLHRSCPPIGPHIEGAYLAKTTDGQSIDLLLYGFKSNSFVVWNETRQKEVLSVVCGGAHRSWAYSPAGNCAPGVSSQGGTFVWTQAGTCNVYRKVTEDRYVIRRGIHGREIKSLAQSPLKVDLPDFGIKDAQLIATGAEDTTIRLFLVQERDQFVPDQLGESALICQRVLNKHTTGIHQLDFSPCGKYLVSSGGCEEMFIWSLHYHVPVIGVGVVLGCMLSKTDVDADARITTLTTVSSEESPSSSSGSPAVDFNIAAAYSNGKVKVLRYYCGKEGREGKLDLLQVIVEGSYCLTQLHCAAFPATKEVMILTAGTNGHISLHQPQSHGDSLRHRIHQNSIQASVMVKACQDPAKWLLATGGDDNALGLTVIRPAAIRPNTSVSVCRTLLISNAHAAAITGLTSLSQEKVDDANEILVIASVSNDQRVKIWRINLRNDLAVGPPLAESEMQDIHVEKIAECWTSVADASAMAFLSSTPGPDSQGSGFKGEYIDSEHKLLVVGVGMEVIKVPCLNTKGMHWHPNRTMGIQ